MKQIRKKKQPVLRKVLATIGITAVVAGVGVGTYYATDYINGQNTKIETLQTQVEESEKSLQDSNAKLANAKAELTTLSTEKANLQKEVSIKVEELTLMNADKVKLQSQITTLTELANNLTTDKENLQNQLNEKLEQIENLNSEIVSKNNLIASLNEQIETLNATISDLENQNNILTNQNNQLTQDKADLQEQLAGAGYVDGYKLTSITPQYTMYCYNAAHEVVSCFSSYCGYIHDKSFIESLGDNFSYGFVERAKLWQFDDLATGVPYNIMLLDKTFRVFETSVVEVEFVNSDGTPFDFTNLTHSQYYTYLIDVNVDGISDSGTLVSFVAKCKIVPYEA